MKFNGPIIVTSCSNRKRYPAQELLDVQKLKFASFDKVATQWLERTHSGMERFPASELYQGRSVLEVKIIKEVVDGHLFFVSAGLGLVAENTRIPSYNLTVSRASNENVQSRIKGGGFSHAAWWRKVSSGRRPYSSLYGLIRASSPHAVAIAMPTQYWELVKEDLERVPESETSRLRLFGPKREDVVPEHLICCVMPYDDRLDGPDSPLPGTKVDFPQRSMRHFIEHISQSWGSEAPEKDAQKVRKYLAKYRAPLKFNRESKTDDQLIELIQYHWNVAEGKATQMLRYFRDDLQVACEQKRFQGLFQTVRQQRLEER